MRQRFVGIALALVFTSCLVESEEFAFELTITEALEKCLTGRCGDGEVNPDKMPPYNLGSGYTCDIKRYRVYNACRRRSPQPSVATCTAEAEAARENCKKNICDEVYDQCINDKCERADNTWDCWRKVGEELKFGYWEWIDGKWVFVEVPGQTIPDATWKTHCEGQKTRCQAGIDAQVGDTVPPIDRSFCSAACYGHNCHHAAASVCQCIKDNTGDADPVIVVFDGGVKDDPNACPKPGDIFHSVIAINHPTEAGKRCLVESQRACNPKEPVEPGCCYRTIDEYKNLDPEKCSVVRTGPKRKKMSIFPFSKYTCEEFLEARGTQQCGLPPNPSQRVAGVIIDETEETIEGGLACAMACGENGLRSAVGDAFGECPSGTHCEIPASAAIDCSPTCEDSEPCTGSQCPGTGGGSGSGSGSNISYTTSGGGSCQGGEGSCDPVPPPPTYRGECVPDEPEPPCTGTGTGSGSGLGSGSGSGSCEPDPEPEPEPCHGGGSGSGSGSGSSVECVPY